MIKRTIINLSFLLIFLSSGIMGQNIKPEDVVSINPVTKIKFTENGSEANINFILNIKRTWHINSNQLKDQSLTPTVIKFDASSFYAVQKITYPPAEMVKLQFSDNELALYEQEATINVIVNIGKNFNKKSLTIKGQLQYQPCNNQTCLFPVSKPFTVEVKLKK